MNRRERVKSYITIVLSMILGLVCFALAGVFFSAAFAQGTNAQLDTPRAYLLVQNTNDGVGFEY